MPDFIYDIPTTTLAVYFAILSFVVTLIGLLIVKPIFRLLIGAGPDFNNSINQATAGFSLFYGLLLGLLTVSAYQNNERVRDAILAESTTLGSLYADMNTYPEPLRSDMKALMRDYVLFTIYEDWPAHREGEVMDGGFHRADAMRQQLASFEPQTRGEEVVHAQVIGAFQEFSDARQRRLTGVITQIPDILWYAVLVGALMNVLLIVLLKIRPLQHLVLGTISTFFLGVILCVIISLDKPLRGEAGLDPDALDLLWERSMVWDEPLA